MAKRGIKSNKHHPTTEYSSLDTEHLPFPQTSSLKLIRPGIRLFRNNFETSLVILVIPGLLLQLGSLLVTDPTTLDARALLGGIVTIFAGVWLILNLAVNYYFQLQIVRGRRPTIRESYYEGIRFLPRLIGLAILSFFAIGVGLLLLIVPGIIAIRRYALAPFFLVDNDTGIREAMQLSAAASKPASGYVWSTIAILITFGVLGWAIGDLLPTYGDSIAILLTGLYVFVPGLRYREIGLRQSALTVED